MIGCTRTCQSQAPRDGALATYTGLVVDALAALSDELPVRLHVALLEVVRELVKVLVVREEELRLRAVKVVVPEPDEREEDGEVLLEWRGLEVLVHAMRTAKQLLKVVVPDDERDREADRGPERVAPADPVPELEHVGGRDAELGDRLRVRAQRDKVFRDVRLVLRRREEPLARGDRVRDRLLCRERLASDDKERRFRVAHTQRLRDVRAVDVGHKVRGQVALRVGLERLRDHDGAEVRATNADVHDGVNGLAGVSLPCAAADGLCELLDVRKDSLYLAHTGLLDLEVVEVAERDVEYGAVLGGVDVLTGEHLVAIRLDICLASQREQGLEDRVRDQVLGVVEQEGDWRAVWRDILLAELGESLWVLGKEVLEDEF